MMHKPTLILRILTLQFCLTLIISLFVNAGFAQNKLIEKTVIPNLQSHIRLLASDSLRGREAGTPDEAKAAAYIVQQFKSIGIEPRGDNRGYTQNFSFTNGLKYGSKNSFVANGVIQKLEDDYYPLAYSGNASVKGELLFAGFGIIANKLGFNDYENLSDVSGKILVMEISSPDGMGPHSKFGDFADLRQRIDSAALRGALAVVFINSDTSTNNPGKKEFQMKITPSSIPVLFSNKSKADLFSNAKGNTVSIETEVNKEERIGKNVIGYINNHAKNTIVLGAHYDHLGMGEQGSLYKGAPAIHNGADDNASGVSALIELARILKKSSVSKSQKNNYLFIAFSGEEKGLYGSASFVKTPTVSLDSVTYMLNMDMVGRLESDHKLAISGVGTSPVWAPLLASIQIDSIIIKTSDGGVGPSDHTSFYLKNIPVLHFFTGSHSDYHKPTDDEPKINYIGEASVMKCILLVIDSLNDKGKLAFTKTKDEKSEDTPRFKVTLGVVPDYMFDGTGMRIDGVTDGKPASKAGLLAGDVVVAIGTNKVTDMMSYMKALSMFKKGDETTVDVVREKQIVQRKIQF